MTRGYISPTIRNPGGSNDADFIIYGYVPSLLLAIIGIVTFVLCTCVHIGQVARYRTWYFTLLVVGSAMEIVGYIFRSLSSKVDPYFVPYFVVQYFFIVVAPVFFSAGIYVVLSKFITIAGRSYAPLPPKFIVVIFVVFDVVTTVIQIVGAALIGTAESNNTSPKTANNILLAGLAIQVASFAVFLVLLALCILRILQKRGSGTWAHSATAAKLLLVLVVTSFLVELRTIFRLIETAQGVFGYLSSHEVYFGCLEYLPIILTVSLWNFLHPGFLLRDQDHVLPISSRHAEEFTRQAHTHEGLTGSVD